MKINFILNDEEKTVDIQPDTRLVDLLRERFNLLSVKEGCGQGECGACTVIIDGKAVTSCLILVSQIEGSIIWTVEGLEKSGELEIFKKYFKKHGAVQCGYCTPGMVMSARALLNKNKHPDREEIKKAIAGNLCRCTGYNNIIDAITAIAEEGGFGV